MTGRYINRILPPAAVVLLSAFVLGSCSQGPPPVRPGTAAFYWTAADAAWKAGDCLKANDNLNQLVSGNSEYAARARAWQLIAAPGLAEGYNNLADAYESAGRYNRAESAAFREQALRKHFKLTETALVAALKKYPGPS